MSHSRAGAGEDPQQAAISLAHSECFSPCLTTAVVADGTVRGSRWSVEVTGVAELQFGFNSMDMHGSDKSRIGVPRV